MKVLRRILLNILAFLIALAITTYFFMRQKSFGRLPSGKRLERISKSPNFRDGIFQNVVETKMLTDDASYPRMLKDFFFGQVPGREPGDTLPSLKTDLKSLSRDEPSLVWFGHSSYLITINGVRILADPVFSERASPVQYMGSKAYPVVNPYTIKDFPDIDVVVISHDHYDHLDYGTIQYLSDKVKVFCVGLGVGEHLEYWGVDPSKIREFDWWEGAEVLPGLELTATPARHFSGRGFTRFKTLWASFVVKTGGKTLFIGGDSGYDVSFKNIGDKFGPFDLVMLECGQYGAQWPFIHMMPEQTVQASVDLKAKVLLPVHWGKFTLANHPWKEPVERATKHAESLGMKITTPLIGEVLKLDSVASWERWWRQLN